MKTFEPGKIVCQECRHKPEDPWDEAPEGFVSWQGLGEWYCEDCDLKLSDRVKPKKSTWAHMLEHQQALKNAPK